jgi:hypothetical protein
MLVSVTRLGLQPAEQRVEEAKLKLREAEVAAEQVKLALDVIGLQERKAAVGLRDGGSWEGRTSPHPFDPSRRRDTPAPPQDEREKRRDSRPSGRAADDPCRSS